MKIQTILDQIDLGAIALPEFQRGYVWNRDQVRRLMNSLYRKHPIGSLLVWITKTESAKVRGEASLPPGSVKLLLDGQQRITTLYGIIRGKPPQFFEGDPGTFKGLYFHLDEEVFEFYSPAKMKDNPLWIDVTELMKLGVGEFISRLATKPEFSQNLPLYINRLNAIYTIHNIDLHIEEISGEDKTVDVVVEIFNTVNSSGTKLSKGDLALAKICAMWPEARAELRQRLQKWQKAGYDFRLEWFLRNINTILTGDAYFSALKDVDVRTFQSGVQQAEKTIDYLLNLIASRLGLDHDRVLGSRYSFPLMSRYVWQRGGSINDPKERDKLLYWYIHTLLWGRYTGSTETVLSQDLTLIKENNGALDRLINQLRQQRGSLQLAPEDFLGWSKGARFYPLLYMMIRVCQAKDWDSGLELSKHLLGKSSSLHLHHIFPKSQLYKHPNNYTQAEVNALANFTFLTAETNQKVYNRLPEEYLKEFAAEDIKSHWIPLDRELWRLENYREFLAERRKLLAAAANDFLANLLGGAVPEMDLPKAIAVSIDEGDQTLQELNAWVQAQGLPAGEFNYELCDPVTNQTLAILDLAWPEGLQVGFSQPAAFLLEETEGIAKILTRSNFRYFYNIAEFKEYVLKEILGLN